MQPRLQAERIHDRSVSHLPINARVAPAVVDDPYGVRGEKITVTRSVRDDPLADMLSRGIIDTAMFNAGREWQKHYEALEIGPISAVDTTKEPVDGGGSVRDPLNDRQRRAVKKIAEADKVLGQTGAQIVRKLLAEQQSMRAMCVLFGCDTARKATFLSIRVRECLEDLGMLWGFIQRANRTT